MTMLTAPTPDRVLTDYPAENDRWQWNRVQRTLENEASVPGRLHAATEWPGQDGA